MNSLGSHERLKQVYGLHHVVVLHERTTYIFKMIGLAVSTQRTFDAVLICSGACGLASHLTYFSMIPDDAFADHDECWATTVSCLPFLRRAHSSRAMISGRSTRFVKPFHSWL